jgi:RHS repeat-associated protein
VRRLLSVLGLFWCGLACASLPRDSLARLDYTALVNHWGHVLDGYGYGYDFLGLRTNITRDLGLTNSSVAVGYDSVGQLTSWQAREGLTNAVRLNEQNGWAYDAAGNLRYRTNGGLLQTFTTDPVNQLTNVTRNSTMTVSGVTPAPASSVTVNGQPAQTYGDFTFARTNVTLSNGDNTFSIAAHSPTGTNTTNNLTVNLPGAVTLLYDANGNLTSDGARSFAYDAENQLTNIAFGSAWKTEFVYDGLGRRRIARDYGQQGGQWVQTNETRYVYDGYLAIQERDSNNAVKATYTRGLDLSGSLQGAGGIGGLLARTDGSGSTFYHADGAGNITALMDGQQNITARYLYGAFGKLTGKWGPMADVNVMQFSSMPVHRLSGFVHFHGREYGPDWQGWLQRDPIGEAGGINLYRFVGNNPLGNVDPLGLSWRDTLHEIGQGIYDLMMGDQSGQYNQFTKGALDAQMGVVDIDRNNNVLRDSMGGGVAVLGELGKEAALYYAGGKVAEAGLGIAGAAVCKAKPLLAAAKDGIQFGQASVKSTFAHGPYAGQTIGEVAQGLRAGTISPNILPIDYVVRNGQAVTLNNRSLLALRRAGIEPTVTRNLTGNPAAEALLNSHLQSGAPSSVIRVRGGPLGTALIE